MQIFKKYLFHIVTLMSTSLFCAQQQDVTDGYQRTPLMNYVMRQDKVLAQLIDDVKAKKKEANALQHIGHQKNPKINILVEEVTAELLALKAKYDATLSQTIERIKQISQENPRQFTAKDYQNNSVLDIVQTKEIYDALRAYGAHFQVNAWYRFVNKPSSDAILLAGLGFFALYDKNFWNSMGPYLLFFAATRHL